MWPGGRCPSLVESTTLSWKRRIEHEPIASVVEVTEVLVLLLDTTVSLVLYFSAKYLAAGAVEDIKTVILACSRWCW